MCVCVCVVGAFACSMAAWPGREHDPSGEVQFHVMTSKFTMTATSWAATTALSGANSGSCVDAVGGYGTVSDPIQCSWSVSGHEYSWSFTVAVFV